MTSLAPLAPILPDPTNVLARKDTVPGLEVKASVIVSAFEFC